MNNELQCEDPEDDGLYIEIEMYVSDLAISFVPVFSSKSSTKKIAIIFDRFNQEILTRNVDDILYEILRKQPGAIPCKKIYGILGILSLSRGLHIIVIESRALLGIIKNHSIFRITGVNILQIFNNRLVKSVMSTETKEMNEKNTTFEIIKSVKNLLEGKDFYFSYTLDISKSVQKENVNITNKPLWKRWDDRFFSNKSLVDILIKKNLNRWILPVLRGYIQMHIFSIDKQVFEAILISRLCRFRNGTRFNTRGLDMNGNAANFIETEQILYTEGHTLSFIQIRGSIPLLWTQNSKRYIPIPQINPDVNLNAKLFNAHFKSLSTYGRPIVLSLLDKKGTESQLHNAFRKHLLSSNLDHLMLDFHSYSSDKIGNVILELVSNHLDSINYYHEDFSGNVLLKQTGVIRTNCLDCLDRTNFAQSIMAKHIFFKMLMIFKPHLENKEVLNSIINETWVNNGNCISHQYAGTNALKNDLTLTGKRKTDVIVKDKVRSISRYCIRHFKDRMRQIAIELFYGYKTENSPYPI